LGSLLAFVQPQHAFTGQLDYDYKWESSCHTSTFFWKHVN